MQLDSILVNSELVEKFLKIYQKNHWWPALAQPLTSSKMFTSTQSLASFNLKNLQAKLFLSSCGLYGISRGCKFDLLFVYQRTHKKWQKLPFYRELKKFPFETFCNKDASPFKTVDSRHECNFPFRESKTRK